MTEPERYDLVILGGGPAGINGASTAAAFGKSIVIIDSHPELGGAGVNTGTIPSKTLRETALTLSGARSRNLYGVDLSLRRDATISDFLGHERAVRSSFNSRLARQMKDSRAVFYSGSAEFLDAHRVAVRLGAQPNGNSTREGEVLEICGDHFLAATGSSPVRPPGFPFNDANIFDSDSILELKRLPKSMAIVGAGTIGCEYACIFAALHCDVHVVDGRGSALSFLDSEIVSKLTRTMERNGVMFHWNEQVSTCSVKSETQVVLHLGSGSALEVEAVLVAAGRKSNTADLHLERAGIELWERGLVPVDAAFRTKVGHIYAAGDVIGPPALASTSADQARRAMRHAFAKNRISEIPSLLPTGVYTIPEIGSVGATEEELRKTGTPYVVGRATYDANGRGKIIGDSEGMLKLLFRPDDLKLLGVHAIGEQATELVHIGFIAMLRDCNARLFDEVCFNLPTLGQMYKTAALDALRQVNFESK